MANIYVRSTDGSDADNGSTWALAKATVAGALAVAAAGDTIYVSQAHAETQASAMTWTSPGTAANPVRILCANDGAEPPTALATTATVATTGASTIAFGAGYAYVHGIIFSAGSAGSNASITWGVASAWWRHEACAFRLGNSNTSGAIAAGVASTTHNNNAVEWYNCTVQFGAVGQSILVRDSLLWFASSSTAVTGATIPTSLFKPSVNGTARVTCIGVDFSALGSGKNIVDLSVASASEYTFVDCKLGASVGLTTGSIVGQSGAFAYFINCDSADTQHRYHYQDYAGTISQETTIVRTGGASDGTTAFSRKFVTTANAKFYAPLYGPWFKVWNTTLSAQTMGIEVLTDNVTLKDDEAWIEVEYQGSSGVPCGVFARDRAADVLATGANQATSSEAWTTTGLGTPVTQVLSVSVTPQETGWIRARVVVARPSTTIYACPKILSTSAAQRMMSPDGDIVNAPAGGSGARSFTFGG